MRLICANGLKIRTVAGVEFDVMGVVTYDKLFDVYYCGGQSWPSQIVLSFLDAWGRRGRRAAACGEGGGWRRQ